MATHSSICTFAVMLKYTKSYLTKLEDLVVEGGYLIRYERGSFKSGFCILKDHKMVLINNFLPLEGRVNCILELAGILQLDESKLSAKSQKLLHEIRIPETKQTEISFEQQTE
jgi:hypothetical protein